MRDARVPRGVEDPAGHVHVVGGCGGRGGHRRCEVEQGRGVLEVRLDVVVPQVDPADVDLGGEPGHRAAGQPDHPGPRVLGDAARHASPEGGVDTRDHDSLHAPELATQRLAKPQACRPTLGSPPGSDRRQGRGWRGSDPL